MGSVDFDGLPEVSGEHDAAILERLPSVQENFVGVPIYRLEKTSQIRKTHQHQLPNPGIQQQLAAVANDDVAWSLAVV